MKPEAGAGLSARALAGALPSPSCSFCLPRRSKDALAQGAHAVSAWFAGAPWPSGALTGRSPRAAWAPWFPPPSCFPARLGGN